MSNSLFSQSWYKVANLKVRLRTHANIHRHVYRDRVWFVLQDHMTGQFQRFTPQAYQLIGLMDGHRTLQQVWDLACESLGDELPTQDEVIQLVGQLNKANVIQTDVLPSIEHLHRRQKSEENKKFIQQIKSPLSIRIPVIDPERFLNSTRWVAKVVFSPFGAFIWLLVMGLGITLSAIHWDSLTHNLSDQVLSVDNLLIMALVYPMVKLVHELGHGYAVKRWGGEVHEMGIMLLIFIPVPYVDASTAASFRNKHQRMLVGAVGVLGELFMAALAMIVWSLVEPGLVRAMAYNVMLIGGISTLLFNGNPLLRFDAYYVLADYLEIPNLASRGNAQIGYLVKRYCFRISEARTNAYSRSESMWLASYSVAAYVYRLFVMVAISLFVASQYLIVGVLLALWSVWSSLFAPIFKVMAKPMKDPLMRRKNKQIYLFSTLFLAGLLGMLFFLPVPHNTYAQGVLYVPNQSYVKAEVSGFVDRLVAKEASFVETDDILLQMNAPDIQAEVLVLEANLREAKVRYEASISDRSESDILLQELRFIEQEYQSVLDRLNSLTLYSRETGIFTLPNRRGIEGRYFNRGEVIGYVVDYQNLPLTVMISEDDIDRVRTQTRAVALKFVSTPEREFKAAILRQIPSSTQQIPSSVLTTDGGGLIALDPNRTEDLKSYQSYFRLDLDSLDAPKFRFDERVHVMFQHDPEPLVYRWHRSIRRVFLRQFDV
ncbi:efflux RND transporter periplasmic adaptor subunit [Vibrio genomosp. F10]|uniref:efflux RND transporter periplasmic adaptor subunit n=1 Tax=Vibrio genomosp. F10 TaxID=723171 RepID=UPI00036F073D|nr:efflux RND transporter periplasmic adaptor subunit [Vibrio genomosp. F10]OEE88826.1 peptidase M50 [Vibrio genomosp. F10 str. 9ZD137]